MQEQQKQEYSTPKDENIIGFSPIYKVQNNSGIVTAKSYTNYSLLLAVLMIGISLAMFSFNANQKQQNIESRIKAAEAGAAERTLNQVKSKVCNPENFELKKDE
jgi:hypothetical protein